MSQMELLVTNVAELLTAAVQEVLQLMAQAVLEHQEETARTRLENHSLTQKLKELQERTAQASDEVQQVSFSRDDPHSLEDHDHTQEDLIYHEDSAEETEEPESLSDYPLHIKIVLDEIKIGHQHKSLQAIPDSSLKKQRPLSRPPKTILNPSPGSRETPATSNITTPSGPNRLKAESKPEPLECSVTDDVTPQALAVPVPLFVNEHCTQPVTSISRNILHYNQSSKLDSTSDHILRSRVENSGYMDGVHGAPGISESPHGCHMCGKTFATASSLGAHFVCHSNERPFVCKCCKFRFSRSADLKKHERIHTGERPYNCSLCGRRFNRTENLRRHLRKVHYGAVL